MCATGVHCCVGWGAAGITLAFVTLGCVAVGCVTLGCVTWCCVTWCCVTVMCNQGWNIVGVSTLILICVSPRMYNICWYSVFVFAGNRWVCRECMCVMCGNRMCMGVSA